MPLLLCPILVKRRQRGRVHPDLVSFILSWASITVAVGTGTVDQQRAQVEVAALAEAQQPRLAAGGHLLRHQTKPCRQVASTPECLGVTDRRRQRGRV